MSIEVSVVVPVYNPGVNIDACLRALLGQTLDETRYEVVLVDDGSTDGTPALLQRWSDRAPGRLRVITQPNSGWPGRPRNVGVDAARGDYVQFVDNDDILAPHALARMLAAARDADADVVIGKLSSDFRIVNHAVYRANAQRVTWRDFPLVESLTPHKMFRTALLREHEIRFAEGPRHLEDQLFCMHAYAHARSVAVVADEPCYFYRRRQGFGRNAGDVPADPDDYYRDLEDVLDVIDGHVDDEDLRSALYERFYRVEMLGRLRDSAMLDYNDDYRARLFARVHELAERRVSLAVDARLPFLARAQALLLRAGDPAGMLSFATDLATLTVEPRPVEATWRAGRLSFDLDTELHWQGRPWRVDDARQVGDGPVDLTSSFADVVVVARGDQVTWFAPPMQRVESRTDGVLGVTAHVEIDPRTIAGGGPLPAGLWDVRLRVVVGGMTRTVSLSMPEHALTSWCAYDDEPHTVAAYRTAGGTLALDVGEWMHSLTADVAAHARPEADGRRWSVGNIVAAAPLSIPATVFTPAGARAGSFSVDADGARLVATHVISGEDLWVRIGAAGRSAPSRLTAPR